MSSAAPGPASKKALSDDEREDRIRVVLGIASALILVSSLSCCCLGSALVAGSEGVSPTHSRPRHP